MMESQYEEETQPRRLTVFAAYSAMSACTAFRDAVSSLDGFAGVVNLAVMPSTMLLSERCSSQARPKIAPMSRLLLLEVTASPSPFSSPSPRYDDIEETVERVEDE
jgi:hypothetical protein